ncbi:AbrB family transcriptional regulator [Alkalihalobacillus sp. LMS39]|uniref:AbrB family transcriptional regulator n=1 Tax=Alkalihalobacillus sp. LMS39 TaxID=2924032 RepID=UPI001FB3EDF2|nr:AbrB family transcriptional regulator [Alkalihalobacillus sp. LMS39]UOE92002.1 AbrB family transcriptional regulator [Alkalihalobacillus sp. LMS39]
MKSLVIIMKTYSVALIGGVLFFYFHLPVPWLLGPLTAVLAFRIFLKQETNYPLFLKNLSFIILGTYFGLSFTRETFVLIGPYLLPFLFLTLVLIFVCICNALMVSRWIEMDKRTSVLSAIPGGLSEMAAVSESIRANTSMVTIFQTIRLLAVVFIVPFFVVLLFSTSNPLPVEPIEQNVYSFSLHYVWFVVAGLFAWILRKKIVAAFVIVPLFIIALLQVGGLLLPVLPDIVILFAQMMIGISIGSMMKPSDLKLAGKYSIVFFLIALITILLSFLLGFVFSQMTDISMATGLLSVAPGGLVEMVLTAKAVGADPAIVSSLQFVRLLIILIFVPPLLKWAFHSDRQ